MKLKVLLQVFACLTLWSGVVNAEISASDHTATADEMKKTAGADGWSKSLKFSGNGGLAIHKSHLSQTNGESYSVGAKLDGTMTWKQGNKEWRNSLLIDQSTSKIPTFEHYIKGTDLFKIQSIYLWGLESMPKLGPYVKGSYDTALFKNHKYLTGAAPVIGDDLGPRVADNFRLSDGLGSNPQTIKVSTGLFYKAIEDKNNNLVLTAGLGMVNVTVDGYSHSEVAGVNVLTELDDYTDFGLVLGLDWKGMFDAKTGWHVGFESLTPFDKGDDKFDDEDLLSLTNYEGFIKLDSKLYDWLSLGYEFRAIMQPKLQAKEQVSNTFGLSLTYLLL